MNAENSRMRLDAVQLLRGVAALLVVFVHAISSSVFELDAVPGFLASDADFRRLGASGVDMFFVISGFIMAHVLQNREPGAAGSGMGRIAAAWHFALLRLLRVVPYYWLMSVLFWAMRSLAGHDYALAQFLSGFAVFPVMPGANYEPPLLLVGWTLGFELAFYTVVAAALIAVPARAARLRFTLEVTVLLAVLGWSLAPDYDALAVWFNPIWLEFAFGILAYMLWQRLGRPLASGWALALLLLGIAGLGATAMGAHHFDESPTGLFNKAEGISRTLWWGLPSVAILLGLLWLSQGRWSDYLRGNWGWRAMQQLGDASYSLYLTHLLVIGLIEDSGLVHGASGDLVIMAVVAACIITALAAHRWIEVPLLAWCRNRVGRGQGGAKPARLVQA